MARQQDLGSSVRVFAESPKVAPEPDFGTELTKMFKNTLGVDADKTITAQDRITPVDRWFGWDKNIISARNDDDPFVDSSDELNYVTLTLEKPLGMELLENPRDEGGGVMVGEIRAGYSAFDCNLIDSGFHLIQVDDTPVYGLPFEEAISPIIDAEGVVTLTFFKGEAVYFYGEYRPSSEWLAKFSESLRGKKDLDEQ